MGKYVNEKDLKDLFKAVVTNLLTCIENGTASPKDKEIALKLIEEHNIGIELGEPGHLDVLDSPLPFDEIKGLN